MNDAATPDAEPITSTLFVAEHHHSIRSDHWLPDDEVSFVICDLDSWGRMNGIVAEVEPRSELYGSEKMRATAEMFANAHEILKERDRLRKQAETLLREREGEVWIWQGDDHDDPDSLACPVLMQPDDVRDFVAVREREQALTGRLETLEAALQEVRKAAAPMVAPRSYDIQRIAADVLKDDESNTPSGVAGLTATGGEVDELREEVQRLREALELFAQYQDLDHLRQGVASGDLHRAKEVLATDTETCTWEWTGPPEFSWETECGELWQMSNDEDPAANGMRYCHHCGLPIEQAARATKDTEAPDA